MLACFTCKVFYWYWYIAFRVWSRWQWTRGRWVNCSWVIVLQNQVFNCLNERSLDATAGATSRRGKTFMTWQKRWRTVAVWLFKVHRFNSKLNYNWIATTHGVGLSYCAHNSNNLRPIITMDGLRLAYSVRSMGPSVSRDWWQNIVNIAVLTTTTVVDSW